MNWYKNIQMSNLSSLKIRDLIKILQDKNCYFQRQSGGHQIWRCPNCSRPIPVPIHGKDMDKRLLYDILKHELVSKNIFDIIKISQFTQENTQNVSVPIINIQPYEPMVQEVVDEIRRENPNFFVGVNKINLDTGFGQFGSVSSQNPADININFNKIKSDISSQLGTSFDINNINHKNILKNAIKETIVHEKAHVQDASMAQEKSEIPLSGENLFPGGESVAERATQNYF